MSLRSSNMWCLSTCCTISPTLIFYEPFCYFLSVTKKFFLHFNQKEEFPLDFPVWLVSWYQIQSTFVIWRYLNLFLVLKDIFLNIEFFVDIFFFLVFFGPYWKMLRLLLAFPYGSFLVRLCHAGNQIFVGKVQVKHLTCWSLLLPCFSSCRLNRLSHCALASILFMWGEERGTFNNVQG